MSKRSEIMLFLICERVTSLIKTEVIREEVCGVSISHQ